MLKSSYMFCSCADHMKCPICNVKVESKPKKTWEYSIYYVSRYLCSHCDSTFNVYSVDEEIKFTVPKAIRSEH